MVLRKPMFSAKGLAAVIAPKGETFLFLPAVMALHKKY
jgi:hypothetical protein